MQTPDQRQWIDLELLNPKFLKGLSLYAPSVKDEPNSKLGKGAAKIKAWARQSKAGIDIRLRRRINSEKDEITDIRLVPDAYPADFAANAEKSSLAQELPAMRSIAELADTTTAMELDATPSGQPSRSSTGSTLGEPLPRYEREPGNSAALAAPISEPAPSSSGEAATTHHHVDREVSPVRSPETRHRPSVSQSSIVATPTRGLSLRDATDDSPPQGATKSESDEYATLLKADLEDANKKLEQERQLSESLQAVIQAISEEQSWQQAQNDNPDKAKADKQPKRMQLNRLKIANRTTYETETEHEPPPPPTTTRRKNLGPARRKKSVSFPDQTAGPSASSSSKQQLSDTSDGEPDADAGTLIRKQTLPKRVPTNAGVDALWRSLIRMQTILLGADHPLSVRAKSDKRARRPSGPSADLTALGQSKLVAERDFGSDHPWVSAFSEDLEKLRSLAERPDHSQADSPASSKAMPEARTPLSATSPDDGEIMDGSRRTPPQVTVTGDPGVPPAFVETPLHKIDTSVQGQSFGQEPSPVVGGVEIDSQLDVLWNTGRLPHQPQNNHVAFVRLGLAALFSIVWSGIEWLQTNYGPEQPVAAGKTRVRWTCSCGERLHDDFVEKRPGAARALEAYLNRPKGPKLTARPAPTYHGNSPTTAGSSPGRQSMSSSFGAPPSSHTSYSNNSFPAGSWPPGSDSKPPQHTWSGTPSQLPFSPTYEPPWLLVCATEARFTPKVTHLDMSPHRIHSDADLATALRAHYFRLHANRWWRGLLRLRGLATIEFVQFEAHRNRFADIRKVPDVPLPGRADYAFEPSDLLPPVGSRYLLHLFRHPEDYDGELITYLRAPKKSGRLQLGVGWGINLVEGFLADKVWVGLSAMFALGSLVFGVVYAVQEHDVQGAFGVAAWIVTLGALAAGWLQACLG